MRNPRKLPRLRQARSAEETVGSQERAERGVLVASGVVVEAVAGSGRVAGLAMDAAEGAASVSEEPW